eukprot:12922297-Alexandrium_andersonii.AAC.1
MRGSHGQTEAHAVPRREYDRCDVYGSDVQCFMEMRGSHGWAQYHMDTFDTAQHVEPGEYHTDTCDTVQH